MNETLSLSGQVIVSIITVVGLIVSGYIISIPVWHYITKGVKR